MRRPVLAAVAALSMIGGSSAALAQSAAPLSVAAHLQASVGDNDEANAYRGGIIIPTIVVLGIIALVYALTKGGDPASP